jgi:hypothetical protein
MNRLAESGRQSAGTRKVFSRQRRRVSGWREFFQALLNLGLGAGMLAALLQLPRRLDSVLVVSKVIGTLLAGLTQIALGLAALATGLAQTLGILMVIAVVIGALLLMANGLVRLLRMAVPGIGQLLGIPAVLARLVWGIVEVRPTDRSDR